MWLVGVVIRRYIDIIIIIINFPYSTCIRSFFGSSILTSLFIFKMFFRSLRIRIIESVDSISKERPKKHLKMNKEVRMLLPKKDPLQVE